MSEQKEKYDLPEGWKSVKLKDISLRIHYGYTASAVKEDTGIRFLRITDIQDSKVNWQKVPFCTIQSSNIDKFLLKKGDIVFARTGATVGKSFLIPPNIPKSVFASYLIRIELSQLINPAYVYYFFQTTDYWKQVGIKAVGIGQPNVNATSLSNIDFPLCPQEEQIRIVSKLEEMLSGLEKSKAQLKNVLSQINSYKELILKKAFEGKLTEKWRKEIILGGSQNKSDANNEERSFKKLQDIASVIMGQSPPGNTYNSDGIGTPLINGPVEFGPTPFSKTILSKWTTAPTKLCQEDDLIICVRGSTTGRQNIAGFNACIGRGVASIRATSANQKYINHYINYSREEIFRMGTGTTFPSISQEQLSNFLIPIFSIEEQEQIVNEIEYRFTISEDFSTVVHHSLQQIEVLIYSVLKKAFEGRLIEHNKNDQSVVQLLKDIEIEKETYLLIEKAQKKLSSKIKVMPDELKSILEVLQEKNAAISAKQLWQLSDKKEDIDGFYAELKKHIESSQIVEMPRNGKETFLKLSE